MNFDQFREQWYGRRIDYDHVFKFQCVDLILQYIYECYGIAFGVSGNAIDYWVKTGVNGFNAPLSNKFDKLPDSEAIKGDIVVLYGLAGNPFGHIGIATGNINATEIEILEQNGQNGDGDGGNPDTNQADNVPLNDGNQIRTRYIQRARVAGLLRPKSAASVPITAPAPSVPSGANTVVLPAHVASWAAYRVGSELRKGTSDQVGALQPAKFGGLSYPIVTWVGNYAVEIDTQAFGHVTIWVKDTDAEFTTVSAAPTPSVPINPNPPLPAAPLQAPSSETYDVVVEVQGYISSNSAINHINPKVEIPVGTYFVYNKRGTALNLTKTPGTPGAWVNTADNTLHPPEPAAAPEVKPAEVAAPAKAPEVPDFAYTYKALDKPKLYVAMRDLAVSDLDGSRKTAKMPQYSVTYISGTFEKDGVQYARPKSAVDQDWWYGIEWTDPVTNTANLELESEVFNSKTTVEERRATKTLTKADNFWLAVARVKKLVLGFAGFFGKIKSAKAK